MPLQGRVTILLQSPKQMLNATGTLTIKCHQGPSLQVIGIITPLPSISQQKAIQVVAIEENYPTEFSRAPTTSPT